MTPLPRRIWMLWLQGWSGAPRLVRACQRSWEANNPAWTIHHLNRANAAEFIAWTATRAALREIDQPPEALSDRLRVALLAQHGGVWADATTYCLRPLDDWLPGVMDSGFFAFDRPAADRMISSWFLAATPGNPLIRAWAQRTLEYWQGRRARHHYFWFHYLFGTEYEINPAFRSIYDRTPKVSAAGPHYYLPQAKKLWAPVTERDEGLIGNGNPPILKLTHRLPADEYPAGSVADYLCARWRV